MHFLQANGPLRLKAIVTSASLFIEEHQPIHAYGLPSLPRKIYNPEKSFYVNVGNGKRLVTDPDCWRSWHYYEFCCCSEELGASRSCWSEGFSFESCCTWEHGPGIRCLPHNSSHLTLHYPSPFSGTLAIEMRVEQAQSCQLEAGSDWTGHFLSDSPFLRSVRLRLGRRLHVLDAGAGLGTASFIAAFQGDSVVAFDNGDCQVRHLRRNVRMLPSVTVLQLDLSEWEDVVKSLRQFGGGLDFDVVMCWGMAYLSYDIFSNLIQVIDNVCSENCVIPFQCAAHPEDLNNDQGQNRRLAMEMFEVVESLEFMDWGNPFMRFNKLRLGTICFLQRRNRRITWRYPTIFGGHSSSANASSLSRSSPSYPNSDP